jgi:Flp pilus assembly protein TadG
MSILKINKSRRGTVLVEMALVLPILLLITFGAIEYSYYFLASTKVNLAARAGARAAILPSATDATVQAAVTTAMTDSGLPVSNPACTYTPGLNVASGQMITVTVTIPASQVTIVNMSGLLGYFGGSGSPPNVTANVTMAKEGPSGGSGGDE